jgi:membrane protein DedA with SNARE-associated domain
VDHIRAQLLLFLAVAAASAIPFVPTGEMVSGSSALAANSRHQIYVIFLVTWAASVLGDTCLLLEARLGAGKVRGWLDRWKYSHRVDQAQHKLERNAFSAVVTGRLVPGGRAPVIIALGLSRFRVRRFVLFDAAACGMWAAIYSTIGSVGGRIAKHPILGMALAIAFAVVISFLVQISIRLAQRLKQRRTTPSPDQRPADQRSSGQQSLPSQTTQTSWEDGRIDGRRNASASDRTVDERDGHASQNAELHADPQSEIR